MYKLFVIVISFQSISCTLWTPVESPGTHIAPLTPLEKTEAQKYLSLVQNHSYSSIGFSPLEAKVEQEPGQSSAIILEGVRSIRVYFLDINNDGKNEYVALYFAGGSLKTSGILNVVTRDGKVLEFHKIVSRSLWEDPTGDLSKFHLWLADPPIIRKGGQYLIRYLNKTPSFSIVEYIWKNDQIKKANYIRSNW